MVDNNEKSDAPRKRKSIFGGRRARSSDTPDVIATPVVAPETQSERAQSPLERTEPQQTEREQTAPEVFQPEQTHPDAAEPASAPRAKRPARILIDDPVTDVPDSVDQASSAPSRPSTSLLFQAPDLPVFEPRQGQGRDHEDDDLPDESPTVRRRARRRSGEEDRDTEGGGTPPNTVVKVRTPRAQPEPSNEPQRVRGSTRLEAKKQRRRDGRDAGRRRPVITEAEFLARRESVDRTMIVRAMTDRIQIGVLEDGVLVEHYVAQSQESSLIGNVYLGKVQNVLPSMEAAFVDIGRGRNAVLYSGEVDWDAAAENSAEGKSQARRIELALKPGDKVLVQVTKDPVGHKGARLTSQVSLPGRYLVYVPNGSMNGISRKLPDTERARLKKILKEVLPDNAGVIVRTAAEGATDEQLTLDVNRLTAQWTAISEIIDSAQAPALLHSEPDLLVKIVRDVFNEDFHRLVVDGTDAEDTIRSYVAAVAPDLVERIERYESDVDSFDQFRVTEQIEKALDRKVWLPSGGSLVIDRTEAMTVVDVNTGKFVGSGGNLEETVTKNNLEAAEEIVRQLRLRDIGGIIVVDFIDMVLESNRDLVLRRLVECLSRDRTKHQVAEVTSLGLIQMTRKKLGLGLLESFSEPCEQCAGRGIVVHHDPVTKHRQTPQPETGRRSRGGKGNGNSNGSSPASSASPVAQKNGNGTHAITDDVRNALAKIATSTIARDAPAAGGRSDVAAGNDAETVEATAGVADSAPDTANDDSNDAGSAASVNDELDIPEIDQPDVAAPSRPSRSRGGRRGAVRASSGGAVVSTPPTILTLVEPTSTSRVDEVVASSAEAVVAILDIPVAKLQRAPRKISTQDAELILDSVLDALPEPKQAGQGRSRTSRRASSGGTVSPTPES